KGRRAAATSTRSFSSHTLHQVRFTQECTEPHRSSGCVKRARENAQFGCRCGCLPSSKGFSYFVKQQSSSCVTERGTGAIERDHRGLLLACAVAGDAPRGRGLCGGRSIVPDSPLHL